MRLMPRRHPNILAIYALALAALDAHHGAGRGRQSEGAPAGSTLASVPGARGALARGVAAGVLYLDEEPPALHLDLKCANEQYVTERSTSA
jgi:hypothetical protein